MLEGVPVDGNDREADWEIRSTGKSSASLSPYPFRRDPLELSILARRIPKRPYTDDADLQKVLAQAPYFALKFSLRAGGATLRTRAMGA
jgi:hypothetical protein